ncbi:MAG: tRNA lysidine(34) synthetase TilS [Campylobacterota bacterium]|nr:tRNA lysidine(34) synthetase TilS [Campylobacterota bacterium]
MMLDSCVEFCRGKKNLLAFSAGVDSCALFFLLHKHNIEFDIAIVNYNQRFESKDEVAYAHDLAKQYGKKIYTKNYINSSFSEKDARDFRYDFFDHIISTHHYDTLLTAHQLNDQFEWLLMQFSKGAGLIELLGLHPLEVKEKYTLIRPLLHCAKEDLLNYLAQHKLKYFVDQSNQDPQFTRNKIRSTYSDTFLDQFKQGVQQSFEYLRNDYNSLMQGGFLVNRFEDLSIYKYNGDQNIALRLIDQELKQRGVLISAKMRKEICEQKQLTISHKIVVALEKNKIFIAPSCSAVMPKLFKEKCRLNNIPKNIRPYVFQNNINIDEIAE